MFPLSATPIDGDGVARDAVDHPPYPRPPAAFAGADAENLFWIGAYHLDADSIIETLIDEVFGCDRPVHRFVAATPFWNGVSVFDSHPDPGRPGRLERFTDAVVGEGGLIALRCASHGYADVNPLLPHEKFGLPDGEGFSIHLLVALLPVRTVCRLVEEHLGPLNVQFEKGGEKAA